MTGMISVNMKKVKASAKVNSLIGENYRDEKDAARYDDGKRMIDTGRTGENVFLMERPADYDALRKDRLDRVNEARAGRTDPQLHLRNSKRRLKDSGELQAAASREVAARRKLRADTVDTLGLVIQPSADFIAALGRDEQTRFFRDSLDVMREHPDWFGKIETAVIHYDENTPHMQCLATTINEETLTSDCQKIMGNKSKMSDRQTLLAREMQARGWDVERGIKRVDNPEYKNFKDEMEAQGYRVNRHNDAKLMAEYRAIRNKQVENVRAEAKNAVKESGLRRRETNLDLRESAVKNGERKLASDRESWQKQVELQNSLQLSRENELNRREKDIDDREKSLASREASLASREASFEAARDKFDVSCRKWLRDTNKALTDDKRKNEAEAARLRRREQELDEAKKAFEESASEREKSLTNREKGIARKAQEALISLKCSADFLTPETNEKLQKTENMDDFNKIVNALGDNTYAKTL